MKKIFNKNAAIAVIILLLSSILIVDTLNYINALNNPPVTKVYEVTTLSTKQGSAGSLAEPTIGATPTPTPSVTEEIEVDNDNFTGQETIEGE